MTNSWTNPRLVTPIRDDIPNLQQKLIALLKQDPTPIIDIPAEAKRLYEVSTGNWQLQIYNGTSWTPLNKLQMDVDKVDGYDAAITPAPNTIAVRGADGKLQDDITGNANTASSAVTLSQTLPVSKGGTGATTSEAARSNLGVPPTSHASTTTTHGIGDSSRYGHLKLSDDDTSISGVSGGVAATPAAVKKAKDAANAAHDAANAAMGKASKIATASEVGIAYFPEPFTIGSDGKVGVRAATIDQTGIIQLNDTVTSTSVIQAATANAVKIAYDKAVAAEAAVADALSVGALLPSFASSMVGYLLCNGAAVSRTTYTDLFAILGTTFGTGDGSTTFNLPDFRDKTLWGANGNLKSILDAGLPNFSGSFWAYTVGWSNASGTGPFYNLGAKGTPGNRGGEGGNACTWGFDPARVSSVYGKSTTVQPPAIAVNIFIKY